jgi:sterol 3beta-glucosyltransferase
MHKSFLERGGKGDRADVILTPQMALPERFRASPDNDEDDGVGDTDSPLSARSMYGLLAVSQSQATLPTVLRRGSDSDAEETNGQDRLPKRASAALDRISQSTAAIPQKNRSSFDAWRSKRRLAEGQRKTNLAANMPSLQERSDAGDREEEDNKARENESMSESQILTRPKDTQSSSRQTSSIAQVDLRQRGGRSSLIDGDGTLITEESHGGTEITGEQAIGAATAIASTDTRPLPQVIADIFSFTEAEEVVAEYPCWYLQNVLLQGYMYITLRHVCFYAYLQKRTNDVEKSGQLGKQGRHSYSYRRYHFVLKGDTFSYYRDASDPYFPLGMVDLRYAKSADVTREGDNETSDFTITTADRIYLYRADSVTAAKSWVKQLQKVIFRTHNDGDSIKISLPIANLDDVERMPMLDFAETIKLRVLDGDETFAVDEYFFTFFGESGPKALETLQHAMGETEATREQQRRAVPSRSRNKAEKNRTQRNDMSFSNNAEDGLPHESADSLATSSNQGHSSDSDGEMDPNMSASQMLTGDKVFGQPTLKFPQSGRAKAQEASSGVGADPRAPLHRMTTEQLLSPDRPASRTSSEMDPSRRKSTDSAIGRSKLAALSVANVVRSSGKRMGSYLGTSPTGYINKFAEAVIGGARHYESSEHISAPDTRQRDADTTSDIAFRQQRFQEHFALPATEKLEATYFCYLHKNLPIYGKIYMSAHRFCFRSLIYGVRTKLVIPFREVVNVEMQRGFRLGYSGIVLVIHGHEELFFEFRTENARNDCAGTIFRKLDHNQAVANSTVLLTEQQQHEAEGAAAENRLLQAARKDRPESALLDIADDDDAVGVLSDDPTASLVDLPPPPSMLVTCLTIGSRGDVQPYIALCKGLMAQGHRTRIATHGEFRGWVESHGIEFAEVAGDPAELMRVCVENGMFTIPFFIEANSKFRSWLDGLLLTAWEACQGSDLVIESPSAMCGIHIAEALGVPYFRAFTMPWTRTRAYPHAFAVRNAKMGGAYNYMTYTLFDNVFWTWTEGQINSWRVKTLGIRPTNLDKLQQNKVPFLYNFSPSVVPPPLDFSDWVKVTGYWFLNEGSDYQPPEDLAAFIKKARDDGMKIVYIGFGSVVVNDSRKLTEQIVNAVQKADVRCILSKGWSDRFDKKDANVPDIVLPSSIHAIRSAPHDWLFTQIDAVVHHGGAGTTGASLRAGKPTIIKPFFGDQYFFATRVEDLGVGIHLSKATEHQLGKALWTAVHDDRMQTKARLLGEAIRAQDGVQTAIRAIYSDLDYARSLIKQKVLPAQQAASSKAGATTSPRTKDAGTSQAPSLDLHDEDTEENWTFVDVTAHDDAATGAAGLELDRLAASTPPPILQQQQQQQQQQSTTLQRGLSNLRLAPSLLGRR